ncbi:Ubiquitin-conjugating enzyme domain containing protein [Ceratobasidium theobromae]|uniref:Ubiquitin-conjugating enzyme domain containing protein n=1 Tax=Ceratobasidium theobromae TaxID=1582974 RepID=A0A5N5QLK5_9AGAM|nr:Ubiquitin-conjugating enzyme domain containing protein [Ceratobasidium theobromae]
MFTTVPSKLSWPNRPVIQSHQQDHQKPKDKILAHAKLAVEYAALHNKSHCPQGVYVVPSGQSMRLWNGTIFIHQGYYRSAIFRFKITFPSDYPARAPVVQFTTDVFHPLVSTKDGTFSLAPRIPSWSSHDHNVFHVLHWIKAVFKKRALDELDEGSCLNKEAFRMYQDSTSSFASLAAQSASLSQSSSALYGDNTRNEDSTGILAFSRTSTSDLNKLRAELGLSSWTSQDPTTS